MVLNVHRNQTCGLLGMAGDIFLVKFICLVFTHMPCIYSHALYLLTCLVRGTVGDPSLCCWVCVKTFGH